MDQPTRATAHTSYLVKRVQHELYVRLEEVLRPFDLTAAQYMVLSILGHRSGESSARLARRFSVTPQTMIKLVAALEAKGLVVRTGGEDDRRALLLSLHPAGQETLAGCETAVSAMEAEVFGRLPPGDEARLRRLLVRLLGSFAPGQKGLDQPG